MSKEQIEAIKQLFKIIKKIKIHKKLTKNVSNQAQ